jgi:hypothetical protein
MKSVFGLGRFLPPEREIKPTRHRAGARIERFGTMFPLLGACMGASLDRFDPPCSRGEPDKSILNCNDQAKAGETQRYSADHGNQLFSLAKPTDTLRF